MSPSDSEKRDFWWLFTLLGAVTSTLAIVALTQHAFDTWNLTAPMARIMDAYTATVRLLLGWAEPYLHNLARWVGRVLGWHVVIHPHWRDILV